MNSKIPTQIDKTQFTYEEWKNFRRGYMGSSDVPVVLGLVKYKTEYDVYLDKVRPSVAEAISGTVSKRMLAGVRLEEVIAQWYADESGNRVEADPYIRVHPTEPWAICNIDRLITYADGSKGILECKSTNSHYLRTLDGATPAAYWAQIQWQMWVMGMQRGALAILVDGYDFYFIDVQRDDEYIEAMVKATKAWWALHIEQGVEPQAQAQDVEKMVPEIGKSVKAPTDFKDTLTQIRELEAQAKETNTRIRELRDSIKVAFHDAEYMVDAGGRVVATYKTRRRKGYTVKESEYRHMQIVEDSQEN